jgi:hypothetical protein
MNIGPLKINYILSSFGLNDYTTSSFYGLNATCWKNVEDVVISSLSYCHITGMCLTFQLVRYEDMSDITENNRYMLTVIYGELLKNVFLKV